MAKNKKKEEKAKVVAPAAKAVAPKAEEKKVIVAPKAVAPKAEEKKVEAPAPERPAMPANFCLDQKVWDSNEGGYNPASNGCKACAKDPDFAETVKVCIARAAFIAAVSKKAPKVKGERAPRIGGGNTQAGIMNTGFDSKLSVEELVKAVAAVHYAGDAKTAAKRVSRHIKSILNGTCPGAELLKPKVAYLFEKKAA